jgi:hypothetical protein
MYARLILGACLLVSLVNLASPVAATRNPPGSDYAYVMESLTITNLALSTTSKTFMFYVDMPLDGSTCTDTKRFKISLDDPEASATISLMTAAFLANKKITVYYNVGDAECVSKGQRPGYIRIDR